jgi:UDP-2,3-diacylglucosamine hydrolase
MKYAAISDVHVKKSGDDAEKLLLSFLNNSYVKECDGIFLLGDIFDLMIGPHSQYFSRFSNYFNILKRQLEAGQKIYYVEGNHDFHIKKLYRNFFKVYQHLSPHNFLMDKEFIIEDSGKKIHLSHGDDIEIENFNYRVFKNVVTSTPLTIYANHLMPYFLITKIGEKSSEISRKKNNKRYSTESDLGPVKDKFRRSAEEFYKKNKVDIIVCGHSHVKDYYRSDYGFEYINNGYAQHTKTYISIENGNVGFKNIIE